MLPIDLHEVEGEQRAIFKGCEDFDTETKIISLNVVYCELNRLFIDVYTLFWAGPGIYLSRT